MVFGLPIVSTNCPSGPDEILEGGRLGALVPCENANALAQAMATALPPKGEQTRRIYKNLRDYDVERVIDRYSGLLGSPLASG